MIPVYLRLIILYNVKIIAPSLVVFKLRRGRNRVEVRKQLYFVICINPNQAGGIMCCKKFFNPQFYVYNFCTKTKKKKSCFSRKLSTCSSITFFRCFVVESLWLRHKVPITGEIYCKEFHLRIINRILLLKKIPDWFNWFCFIQFHEYICTAIHKE